VAVRAESEVARGRVVSPTNPANVEPTDFEQADRLIRAALQAARRALGTTAVAEPLEA
jgi:hypothetical protein